MLPILDVIVTGLGYTARRFPGLLAIFWLPGILGTVAIVVLEFVWQGKLQLGLAPGGVRNLVWGPFAAVALLALVRWKIHGIAPVRTANFEATKMPWSVVAIVTTWMVGEAAVGDAPRLLLSWGSASSDFLAVVNVDADAHARFFFSLLFVALLIKAALLVFCFGLIVVTVTLGRPSAREVRALLALDPLRLFFIALVVKSAIEFAGLVAIAFGLDDMEWPAPAHWRDDVLRLLLAEIKLFPLDFFEFATQSCVMAEAYGRLLAARNVTR